jgi:osmotically inducible lipoprotein OsmB
MYATRQTAQAPRPRLGIIGACLRATYAWWQCALPISQHAPAKNVVARHGLPLHRFNIQAIQRNPMKTQSKKLILGAGVAALLAGLGGCAGMSAQDKSTAVGAGVGAVGGAVLTGGSAVGTIGGAAVGGVIGHEVGKD